MPKLPERDKWSGVRPGLSDFGINGRTITPSDSADIADPYPKAVTCLTAGNIAIVPINNDDAGVISFVGVPAGFVPPYQVRRVMATGTTATVATVE